jgi:hypothetical protein
LSDGVERKLFHVLLLSVRDEKFLSQEKKSEGFSVPELFPEPFDDSVSVGGIAQIEHRHVPCIGNRDGGSSSTCADGSVNALRDAVDCPADEEFRRSLQIQPKNLKGVAGMKLSGKGVAAFPSGVKLRRNFHCQLRRIGGSIDLAQALRPGFECGVCADRSAGSQRDARRSQFFSD